MQANYKNMCIYFLIAFLYAMDKERVDFVLFGKSKKWILCITGLGFIVLFYINQILVFNTFMNTLMYYMLGILGSISIYMEIRIVYSRGGGTQRVIILYQG